MKRLPAVLGTCFLGLAFLTGSFPGSATAQKGDKDAPKHKLPTYWTGLKLAAEQKDKIHKIQDDYGPKIEDMKKKLKKLEVEEKQEMFKVLNADQKEQLRKIYVEKTGIDPFVPPSKSTEPNKDKDKDKDKENK